MIVTARLTFSAAHRLHNPARDDAWNLQMYGKDNNPAGHGHNYVITVSVKGTINPETGMVVDLRDLKDIVQRQVIDAVDHNNLNEDVPFLRGIIPTAENMVRAFWQQIALALKGAELVEIVLQETEKNSVVYRGEDEG